MMRTMHRKAFPVLCATHSGKGASVQLHHAVQVVGYNLEKQFWIIKNSW
jgi:C1A family cysteine protease